ncbi:hypothetical protein EfmAA96_09070 [Enterococcus faecium]|nr:hypothetical protein EfmAA96_09070 [Enterococcus faecium]
MALLMFLKTNKKTIIPVKGHQRVVGTKADKIKHLPITEKEHLLPLEEQFCEHCGSQMKDIGRTKVREEIRFHQAMLDNRFNWFRDLWVCFLNITIFNDCHCCGNESFSYSKYR